MTPSAAQSRLAELRLQLKAIRAEMQQLRALILADGINSGISTRNTAIFEMRGTGATYKEIGKQFGISATMAGKIVNKMVKNRMSRG